MCRRPEAHERLALDVLDGGRSEEARVTGVGSVISHHKDLSLGHLSRAVRASVRELAIHVRLFLRLAVNLQHAFADRDFISGQGHDAFDQILLISLHAPEDYYVTLLWLPETVDELVDEDPVADLQRGHHALRRYVERFDDEWPDEAEDQGEGDEDYDQE